MPFQIIKPDDKEQAVEQGNTTIFLAGSIDNGKASLWSHDVQQAMSAFEYVTLFNPRRDHWITELTQRASEPVFNEQVNWELNHIDMSELSDIQPGCDIPFFFFEEGSVSPITLMELGMVIGSRRGLMSSATPHVHKPVVVCPERYWRRGNVEVMCGRHEVPVYDTLEQGISALKIAVEVCRSWAAKKEQRKIHEQELLRDAIHRHG